MRRSHPRWLRAAIMTVVASSLLAAPAQAEIKWGEVGAQTFDALLLRPLGALSTVTGFALFVPAAILASPGGRSEIDQAWNVFVGEPADTTFRRKLGSF